MRCWGHDQPSTCAVGAFRGRPDPRPARLAGDPTARSGSRPRSAGRTPVRQRARGPPRPAALQGHPAAAHPSTLPRSPGAPGRRGRVRSLPEPTHTSEPAEFLLPRAPPPTPGRLTCPSGPEPLPPRPSWSCSPTWARALGPGMPSWSAPCTTWRARPGSANSWMWEPGCPRTTTPTRSPRPSPQARTVCIDNDPLVLAHARALMTSAP